MMLTYQDQNLTFLLKKHKQWLFKFVEKPTVNHKRTCQTCKRPRAPKLYNRRLAKCECTILQEICNKYTQDALYATKKNE